MITPEEIEAELDARFGLASTNQTLGLHYFKLRQVFKEGVEWAVKKIEEEKSEGENERCKNLLNKREGH
jgi:RNA-splicing ligase RtcB